MSLTRIGLAPRAAHLTPAACQAHWRSAHADAALALPGLRGYVQNHAVLRDGAPLLGDPGFDVCAETEFDDLAAMDAGFASEAYRGAIVADEARFIDKARFAFALCERRVLAGGEPPEGAVKLMSFGAAGAGDGDALRHEQLVVSDALHAGREPAPFGVVDIRWFASPEAAQAHAAGLEPGVTRLVARPLRVL